MAPLIVLLVSLALSLMAAIVGGWMGMRRVRRTGNSPYSKRTVRWIYIAVMWSLVLPFALIALFVTGHVVIALVVLIAYAFLALIWSALAAVLTSRRGTGPGP
jgi:hypothetical protein